MSINSALSCHKLVGSYLLKCFPIKVKQFSDAMSVNDCEKLFLNAIPATGRICPYYVIDSMDSEI